MMVPLMVPVMVPVMAAAAAVAAVGPEAPVVAMAAVAERRALIMGCRGELREQLELMLDLMGWTANAVDTPAGLIAALQRQAAEQVAGQALDLLFVDAERIADGGFAINRSRTVVFLGRAPNHGRALFAGKTIIWLDTPLDIVKLERVIVNAV